MFPRIAAAAVAAVAAALLSSPARAQQPWPPGPYYGPPPGSENAAIPPATPDRPAAAATPAPAAAPTKLRWRDTWLIWDNAVTAQTLGIGKNYLSPNPTYEMSGSIRPRYYLYDGDSDAFYAAGRLDLVREFTNSDVTTKRGETTLSDATLLTAYRRTIAKSPGYETIATAILPILTLPSSKFSQNNGTILGLGFDAKITQAMPLAGPRWPVFKTITVGALAGYNHTFTRAVVPTNPDLRRVRLDPEGVTVPGDQLVGAAFPEHELHVTGRMSVDITERFSLFLEASYRPTWIYGFRDNVCITILTGCPTADHPAVRNTYIPTTSFEADLYYDVLDELSMAIGYLNVETQPGLDGERRSLFYSPGSQISFSLIGHLDAIYLAASGKKSGVSGSGHLHP